MQAQWQTLSAKFLSISAREQYLILFAGLAVFFLISVNFFIDPNLATLKKQKSTVVQMKQEIHNNENTIVMLQSSLKQDPNVALRKQIKQYENKMLAVDGDLLKLTSGLINPVQMRHALMELLKLQKGVKLVSFEVLAVEQILLESNLKNKQEGKRDDEMDKAFGGEQINKPSKAKQPAMLALYRHSIKLKLKGRYFKLRDYLLKLEGLSWTFFWKDFQYQLVKYPESELEIEIYSLSTNKEFIGV